MVPKVAARGSSFKGAGLYYLHDKQAQTAERVVFTLTENLPTSDPAQALRYMAYTAMRQNELKAASGQAMTGRKLTLPVYTYSLAWSPEERPEQDEMIEAARETLKILGMEEHEAVFVAHGDEPHPHIHVIVNRVHPRTGLAAKLSKDHLKFSRWAEAYEKRQGQIRCEQRVENNEKRRNGQFVKDTKSWSRAEIHRARKERLKAAFDRRQIEARNLSASHTGQRQALYEEKELRIDHLHRGLRAAYRSKWAQLYRRQRKEKHELNKAQKTAYTRLLYFLKNQRKKEGFGKALKDALRAVSGRDNPHAQLARKHEAERKALAAQITERRREAIREENRHYRDELETLKKLQRGEADLLSEDHSKESQALAREIAEAHDHDVHESAEPEGPPDLGAEFRKRVAKRLRKRKRDERESGKDHDKGRE